MKLLEFDYHLPKELVAQYPVRERDRCALMVLDRNSREMRHRSFGDIVEYFNEGDCLVLNDTKVMPARLFGRRRTGGRVEIFLLEKKNPTCEVLLRPACRLKEGEEITLESGDEVLILGKGSVGRFVKFQRPLDDILNETGHVPLPPYINRRDEEPDRVDYQTVYARKEGATASPTAGLHFSEGLLDKIRGKGVRVVFVTLHTSYGTFAPIKVDDVKTHRMHAEYFELPAETAAVVNETKRRAGRVFAVGTTTTRVLEHCAVRCTQYAVRSTLYAVRCTSGYTDLYIYPSYEFKVVDCLITNFHLPKSTLLLLVSAFAGKELILEAYHRAIEKHYRFFSYGDAMLIL
jgi:S-adenosylmethionine:tRNA ribosyltransferase-isomerase